MRDRHSQACAHPRLKGRSGTCPDCGSAVWYDPAVAPERPVATAAERALHRAVQILSRWSSGGDRPP